MSMHLTGDQVAKILIQDHEEEAESFVTGNLTQYETADQVINRYQDLNFMP